MKEAKKRDYKAEYKKYGSSKKAKKYRAELNAYNRKKGTYGNGDKKDASHKGGKIVGFESQSKNRGRREKSRLKKEQKFGIYKSDLKRIVKEEHQKLTEKKQGYVVADIYGGVYTKKAVSEKKALAMLNKMSHFGGDKIFMIGVEAWNKPHKMNKKKIMVKEEKLTSEQKLRESIREIIEEQLNEQKFKKVILPNDMKTKVKVSKMIKQLKLKIDKDYDVKALKARGGDQVISILPKHYNKFIELAMKNKLNPRG